MIETEIVELEKHRQLIDEGFCVFEKILVGDFLDRVKGTTERLIAEQSKKHFEANLSTGSMISVFSDPIFAELVAHTPALKALADLGYDDPKFSSGYVISKPPQSPPLFWHQDWWGWNDPVSYTELPQQVFLMYYMVDTTKENGCLRLIPGSHLKRHELHKYVPDAHTDDLKMMTNPDHPSYKSHPDELPVPLKAGDLVIGDSRLIHGSFANETATRRTVITLWFHPVFAQLPDCIRAHMGRHRSDNGWPESANELVRSLIPSYDGDAEPIVWNRIPGDALK